MRKNREPHTPAKPRAEQASAGVGNGRAIRQAQDRKLLRKHYANKHGVRRGG